MSTTSPQDVDQALATLRALHPKKIDLGLERIERVLNALGNPHKKLPPIVHIAGTNGKGSTVALLRAMAEAEGLNCHVYTSPHLVHFRERIVVASKEISDPQLIDVIERVRAANDGAPLSFFEATTAAAFLAFAETQADLCIIEVGLGGRFDATNVIEEPAAVGITPVDMDHAEFLGRDLAGIGKEKAGIMKPYCPVAIGPQHDKVRSVMEASGNKNHVKPLFFGQDFRTYRQHGRLVYENEQTLMDLPLPALLGEHQVKNAGLAITLAKMIRLSDKAIANGLKTVHWPARLQNLTSGPYADLVKESGGELWLEVFWPIKILAAFLMRLKVLRVPLLVSPFLDTAPYHQKHLSNWHDRVLQQVTSPAISQPLFNWRLIQAKVFRAKP